MKINFLKKMICSFVVLSFFSLLFAQQGKALPDKSLSQDEQKTEKKSFFKNGKVPYVIFDEGLVFSQVTRIIKEEKRSNFIFLDSLVGAECTMRTRNMEPFNSILRLAVLYPISTGFNGVFEKPIMVVQGGIDIFAGIEIKLKMWDIMYFSIVPGLHGLFQVNDRFTHFNGGAGIYANIELPIAYRWTILCGGLLSLDYPNFGNNKFVEPYDFCYQYQIELAVRYTKKDINIHNYLKQTEETVAAWDKKIADKKAEKAAAKKAAKESKDVKNKSQNGGNDEKAAKAEKAKADKAQAKAEADRIKAEKAKAKAEAAKAKKGA
ncbi:MAG: hypothetical protein ACTTHG_00640 [Treponemataceae bacterium]